MLLSQIKYTRTGRCFHHHADMHQISLACVADQLSCSKAIDVTVMTYIPEYLYLLESYVLGNSFLFFRRGIIFSHDLSRWGFYYPLTSIEFHRILFK